MDKDIRDIFSDEIVKQALTFYEMENSQFEFLDFCESYVYKVTHKNIPYILKISHSRRRTLNLIEGEVDYVNFLAEHGLSIPRAIPTKNGRIAEKIDVDNGYFTVIMFEYAGGKEPGEDSWNSDLYYRMGRLQGKMHMLSKKIDDNQFTRPSFMDDSPVFLKTYLPAEDVIIREKADNLVEKIKAFDKDVDTYGLIHSDFHGGNFFVDDTNIYLFDFDDCMYSWFMHDIAMTIFYSVPHDCKTKAQIDDVYSFINHYLRGYLEENFIPLTKFKNINPFLKIREMELYALIHRSFDLDNLDEWCQSFMENRKEKLEKDIPYFDVKIERLNV